MLTQPGSNAPIIRIENFQDQLHSSHKELPHKKLKVKAKNRKQMR